MRHYLSEKFAAERSKKKLSFRDVALMLGYKNIAKGMNRLVIFEREGLVPETILNQIIVHFGWDSDEVRSLKEKERQEHEAAYQEWLDEPIAPYVIRRFMAAVYVETKVPESCSTQAAAEEFAQKLSAEPKLEAILVLSRRHRVYFSKGEKRSERYNDTINLPVMHIDGSKNAFLLRSE